MPAIAACRPWRRSTVTSSPAVSSSRSSATSGSRRRTSSSGCRIRGLGLSPTSGMSWRLPRLVGEAWARHLLLTGEQIDVETAERIGLVTRVVAADDARAGSPGARIDDRRAAADRPAPDPRGTRRVPRQHPRRSARARARTPNSSASDSPRTSSRPYAHSLIAGRAADGRRVTPGAGPSSERPMGSPYDAEACRRSSPRH